ncbi:MAG: hypothetical protein ACFCUV_16585, partial [Rivularia sp. (in: cyanobacteria)]
MTVTLTKYPTALLNKIGSYACQAVIYIQQQQPELLLDKYKSISWRDNNNQSRLKAKLIEAISTTENWESLIAQIEVFIKALLIPSTTNTPVLIKLQEKIRQLNPDISESKSSESQQYMTEKEQVSNVENIAANSNCIQTSINPQTTPEADQQEIKLPTKYLSTTNILKTVQNQEDINLIEKQVIDTAN